MNLSAHYQDLYSSFVTELNNSNVAIDNLIDSKKDDRYGITLLIRPPENIKNTIAEFSSKLSKIEPDQYYYRNSDIHITVLSIISCYSGFKLSSINIDDYITIIQNLIKDKNSFDIEFNGITATPSGIIIQGFPTDDKLNDIRNNLRASFGQSKLQQSIDKRYTLQTAHSTVVRFRKEISNKSRFISFLEKYRHFHFGTFHADTLELVVNDWYQRTEKVETLATFKLNSH